MSNYQLFLDNANAHNDIKNCICKVFSDIGKTIDLDKMIFEYQPMGIIHQNSIMAICTYIPFGSMEKMSR